MSRRRGNRVPTRLHQPELSSWAQAIERMSALVQAQELGNERLALVAQFTLLEEDVVQARGTELRHVPAWEALGNLLADRAKAARLEQELDQDERQELATYDWTWNEIEAAVEGRSDLELVYEDAQLRLWRTKDGEQVAWERHPGLSRGRDGRDWRYVSEDVSARLPLGKGRNERPSSVGVTVPAGAADPGPGPGEPAPPPGGVALVDQASGQVTGTIEEADSRAPEAAQDETLHEVLARLGYTTTPALFGHKDVVSLATGEVVLEAVDAGQAWTWLRQTGQLQDERLGEVQERADADEAHAAAEAPQEDTAAASGGEPPAAPAAAPATSVPLEDELESLRDYACEIETPEWRKAALADVDVLAANPGMCLQGLPLVRERIRVSLQDEQVAREKVEAERRLLEEHRAKAQAEHEARQAEQTAKKAEKEGNALQRARSRLRAQGPVDEPHVKELKARAQELLAQVYPIRGTAPRDLVDTVRTSDYQALTRVIGQLEKQVQAAQERAARVGGGA